MAQFSVRRLLLGAPLHTGAAPHQRLIKLVALPVFSSDALSSVAYATQETMIALAIAGSAAFGVTIWIAAAIVFLLAIVVISYNQTIYAYPGGGGAYIVARDNLGVLASKVAAVALLTDYVLTVAVSVSSGVDAVLSAYPLMDHLAIRLALNVCATLFIMLMNLRGVKESGALFALPTYGFIISLLTLIGLGSWQLVAEGGFHHLARTPHHVFPAARMLGVWVILQAFTQGCTAVTGVEAISNGIPAFRPPESRNAAITMRWMAVILGTMFLGVTMLAQHLAAIHHLVPSDSGETVISQIAHAVVGDSPFYYVVQWTTFLILVLAANTSFADFPRLSAIAARDDHLPRWLTALGDRLVFQNGIIALAALAIALEVAFKGSTDALIPLYAIGVFVAFSLSQAGMVVRWLQLKSTGWRWRMATNAIGSFVTALVAMIFAIVKFSHGAWVVLLIMPLMVLLLTRIDHHYQFVRRRLRLSTFRPPRYPRLNLALVLVSRLDSSTRAAVQYARLTAADVRALYLSRDGACNSSLEDEWAAFAPDIPLVRSADKVGGWVAALMDELYHLRNEDRTRIYTVVLPHSLHLGSRRGLRKLKDWMLKWTLLHEHGVVVADASEVVEPQTASAATLPLPSGAVSSSQLTDAGDGAPSGLTAGITILNRSMFRRDRHTVLLLVPGLHRGVVEAIGYARQLGSNVRALHIEIEPQKTEELRAGWEQWGQDIPLIVIESPYRQLREPLVRYVDVTTRQSGTDILTVVLPEFVASRLWDKALHNQSGLLLKFALEGRRNLVIANTRYFLDR